MVNIIKDLTIFVVAALIGYFFGIRSIAVLAVLAWMAYALITLNDFSLTHKSHVTGIPVDQIKLNNKYSQIFNYYDEAFHQLKLDRYFGTISEEWYQTKKAELIKNYTRDRDEFINQLNQCPDLSDDIKELLDDISDQQKKLR